MSEKLKSASPSATQIKKPKDSQYWREIERLNQLKKGELIAICHTLGLAKSAVCTMCDKADRVKERAKKD
jgi:uncharacterized Fe-S cluster-containing MiaB family protein